MADKSNEVDIKIKADGNTAIVTISKVKDSVRSIASTALNVSRSIGQALSVFSRLNWIVSSLQLVVEGVKKLREWMNRAATAARELADRVRGYGSSRSAAEIYADCRAFVISKIPQFGEMQSVLTEG